MLKCKDMGYERVVVIKCDPDTDLIVRCDGVGVEGIRSISQPFDCKYVFSLMKNKTR